MSLFLRKPKTDKVFAKCHKKIFLIYWHTRTLYQRKSGSVSYGTQIKKIKFNIFFFRWLLDVGNEGFLATTKCFFEHGLRNFWQMCTQIAALKLGIMSCPIHMRTISISLPERSPCRTIYKFFYLFFPNWTLANFRHLFRSEKGK